MLWMQMFECTVEYETLENSMYCINILSYGMQLKLALAILTLILKLQEYRPWSLEKQYINIQ